MALSAVYRFNMGQGLHYLDTIFSKQVFATSEPMKSSSIVYIHARPVVFSACQSNVKALAASTTTLYKMLNLE